MVQFHILLFIYVFLSIGLYFWLAFRNKERLCRTVFGFFFVLLLGGAVILWLDVNIEKIRGLFQVSVSQEKGLTISYAPKIDDIVSETKFSEIKIEDTISKEEVKLDIEPLEFIFYKPEKPEVEGQTKSKITALVRNRSNELARDIKFNFIIDDGTGRIVSSKEWNRFMGYDEKTFNLYPNNMAFLSWTPDMPSRQFYINNRDKFIKLTIVLDWTDSSNQKYHAENVSEIKYNEDNNNFYFNVIKASYHKLK